MIEDSTQLKKSAIRKLKKCRKDWDMHGAHVDADDVLCSLLISLGFSDVVDEYHKISKWYS